MVLDNWSVQQLRLTIFSSERFPVSEILWKELTCQEEAENRISVPAGRQYSGKMLNGMLALTITASRVDIILGFDPEKIAETGSDQLPVIGPWSDVVEPFIAVAEPFLINLTIPVVRVAFGAALLLQVGSRAEAYEQLSQALVSVKVDVENMRELNFRINWPQESQAIPGLMLNRLTNWAAVIARINVVLPTGTTTSDGLDAISLEIDHNTSPDRQDPFDNAQIVPIFRELVRLASENASGGERP